MDPRPGRLPCSPPTFPPSALAVGWAEANQTARWEQRLLGWFQSQFQLMWGQAKEQRSAVRGKHIRCVCVCM